MVDSPRPHHESATASMAADNKGQHSINMAALRAVQTCGQARLQCQIHHRDRRGKSGSPDLPRRLETRSKADPPLAPTAAVGERPRSCGIRTTPRELARGLRLLLGATGVASWPTGDHLKCDLKLFVAVGIHRSPPRSSNHRLCVTGTLLWRMNRRCRRTGARRGCRRPSGRMRGTRSEAWAMSADKNLLSIPQLRFVVGTKVDNIARRICTPAALPPSALRLRGTDFDSPWWIRRYGKALLFAEFRRLAALPMSLLIFSSLPPLGAALTPAAQDAPDEHSVVGHGKGALGTAAGASRTLGEMKQPLTRS